MTVAGLKAQNSTYHFVSQQQQQVKYDSTSKAYFIDKESTSLSKINIKDSIVSFVTTNGKSSIITDIKISNANLDSLDKKMSFTLNGSDSKSGKQVKLAFWFIAGELDEVSYSDDANNSTVSYKDLTSIENNNSAEKEIAGVRPRKNESTKLN